MSIQHRPSSTGHKVITAYSDKGEYLGVRMALRQENGLRSQMKEAAFDKLLNGHLDRWSIMEPKTKFKIEEVDNRHA